MPPTDETVPQLIEKLADLERKLSRIEKQIGSDELRPNDSLKATRWDISIFEHLSSLRDSLHARANAEQVLIGMIEQLGNKLDRNANLSSLNSDSISKLRMAIAELDVAIIKVAEKLEENISYVTHEKPLLLRDLWWMPTEPIEIGLFICTFGEAVFFYIASDPFLNSAMYRALSLIYPEPMAWAALCTALSIGSMVSFSSRIGKYRRLTAACNMVYFMVTGILPGIFFSGVLGTLHHVLFGLSAVWIVARHPSNSI